MKKNDIIEIDIDEIEFPNKAFGIYDDTKIYVKNGLPGQKLLVKIIKKRNKNIEAKKLEVIKKSPIEQSSNCVHSEVCGGCSYQNLPYNEQLNLKKGQVINLLNKANIKDYEFLGIEEAPIQAEYRNKMEFSFGDEQKDGDLALGLRKKGSFYEVVNVFECNIIDNDYRTILKFCLEYFKTKKVTFYHKSKHEGVLRHLVVRKSYKTKQILINLITTSQINIELNEFVNGLLNLDLMGNIVGVLNTINDGIADVVKCDQLKVLYGNPYFVEEIMGLKFKISAFSFFQTNSLGAEKLYSIAKDFIGDAQNKIIFDLYCGTGTISQIIANNCKKVVGIEIIPEAIEAAIENAKLNKIENCEFIAGDVLKKVDELNDKPDIIILDPPRDGIHPKAIEKIINFKADKIVYMSCKPTSLVRDLQVFLSNGYKIDKLKMLDMFPNTVHVEVVTLLQWTKT